MTTELRNLRAARGLRQFELASELDVSEQAISDWENGKCYPTRKNEAKLFRYFGISIDRLMQQTDAQDPKSA
ncbi:hypothetical protein FACS1894184_08560 [Clostridia bacterium]|nr:hypothetical protein FACS1894184_08560 [Clostridia bacterium]